MHLHWSCVHRCFRQEIPRAIHSVTVFTQLFPFTICNYQLIGFSLWILMYYEKGHSLTRRVHFPIFRLSYSMGLQRLPVNTQTESSCFLCHLRFKPLTLCDSQGATVRQWIVLLPCFSKVFLKRESLNLEQTTEFAIQVSPKL